MAMAARTIEAEPEMDERTDLERKVDGIKDGVAELKADTRVLRADVGHVQEHVTSIKADVCRTDAKVDALGTNLAEHRLETHKSISALRDEMKDGLAALRTEMAAGAATLRAEMTAGAATLRAEMNAGAAALRAEMNAGIAALRAEMTDGATKLRAEMTEGFAALRAEMQGSFEKFRDRHFQQIGWMISTVIAAIGAAFTALKFFAAA